MAARPRVVMIVRCADRLTVAAGVDCADYGERPPRSFGGVPPLQKQRRKRPHYQPQPLRAWDHLTVKGWAVSTIDAIPTVPEGEAGDPAWYPLQHFFGLRTFGVNLFVAARGDETLVAEHDERASGQQELYL